MASFPVPAATCRGVPSSGFATLTSAPRATSSATTSTWRLANARCSAAPDSSLLVQVRAAIDELPDQLNVATFRGLDELVRAGDAGTDQ